jgi:hypothetical protein
MKCPLCGFSGEHESGYGLAAGPMGAYTYCGSCERLIEFSPDTEGMTDEQAAAAFTKRDAWRAALNAEAVSQGEK